MKDLKRILQLEYENKGFKVLYFCFIVRDYFLTFLSPTYNLYVKRSHNELIGYSIMRDMIVHRLVVDKRFRKQGIGKSLIPDYAEFVVSSVSSIKFYERIGFTLMDKDKRIMVRK